MGWTHVQYNILCDINRGHKISLLFFTYVLGSVAIPGVSENDGLDVVDVDDDDDEVLKVIVSLCPNSPPLATMSSPNAS